MSTLYMKIITALVLICGIFITLYLTHRKPPRHSRNISRSKIVLDKLNSFSGIYREAQQMSYLKKIDPFLFEELLLTAFQRRGYTIFRNKRYTGDGGIDGRVVDCDGHLFIVQAKRYNGFVNPQHLRDLASCIIDNRATGGFFIHTGKTSKIQLQKYRWSKISIVSGNRLIKFIQC